MFLPPTPDDGDNDDFQMMMMINMVKMTNVSISMILITICSERSKGNQRNCSLAKKETKKTIYGFK